MHSFNVEKEKKELSLAWLVAMVCTAVVVLALCSGAAYTAVQQARLTAAKASIGQIEAVLLLAEEKAERDGLGAPPETYGSMLKSYDGEFKTDLTPYENYVLNAMLDSFGSGRDFDFAVTRYQDGAGIHTQIYFFPSRGKTDTRLDRHYVMLDGKVTAKPV